MPDYRTHLIVPGPPQLPSPLAVPQVATSQQPAHQALASLDSVMGSGVRVLFELGLRGGDVFLVPNGVDPTSTLTRKYPDKDTPRVVGRATGIQITPGSFVGLDVVAVPSGALQVTNASIFDPDGAGGSITLEVTYTNSDAQTVTVTSTVELDASPEEFAAEPAATYASLLVRSATAIPEGPLLPSSSWWERWTRGYDVTADIVVSYTGSPRPVDVAVVERPHLLAVDEASSRWPSAMYGQGPAFPSLPSEYPIERLSTVSPAGGAQSIRRALYSHGRELGPFLFGWSSAVEHTGDINDWIAYDLGTGDDEAPPAVVTGTTEELVGFGSGTTPGWIVGHYSRQVDHGDEFLDGGTGVIPVWITARCRVSAGTGTYRLATVDGWSEITWTTTSTTWVTIETPGWLEVGIGPEDSPPARLYALNSGANDTEIRDVAVFSRVRG